MSDFRCLELGPLSSHTRSEPTGWHLVRKPEPKFGRRFVNPTHRICRRYAQSAAPPYNNQTVPYSKAGGPAATRPWSGPSTLTSHLTARTEFI